MEELQDAIEDAQYVNAIATQDDGPRPVVAWEKPTEEQLKQWIAAKKPDLNNMDWVLSHAIGFFLFSHYIKKEKKEYARINFCEEIQRLLKLPDKARAGKTSFILSQFLQVRSDNETVPVIGKTEIKETDLVRSIPERRLSDKEVQKLLDLNMDWPNCSESIVGLKGPILKEVKQDFDQVQEHNKIWIKRESVSGFGEAGASLSYHSASPAKGKGTMAQVAEQAAPSTADGDEASNSTGAADEPTPSSLNINKVESALAPSDRKGRTFAASMHEFAGRKGSSGPLKTSINIEQSLGEKIFLDAELVVMESLKRDYWSDFRASESFTKFRNFMWYQDRRVVPEDFCTMRVLGRGGFGLVYGELPCERVPARVVLDYEFGCAHSPHVHHIVTASKKGTSGKLYAMKVMNKRRIKMKRSEQLATNEREALGDVESLFVVNLKYSFHSKDDVYLILDLMTGGDLAFHLQIKGRFPKKECLYYAARMMLGVQDLHNA